MLGLAWVDLRSSFSPTAWRSDQLVNIAPFPEQVFRASLPPSPSFSLTPDFEVPLVNSATTTLILHHGHQTRRSTSSLHETRSLASLLQVPRRIQESQI